MLVTSIFFPFPTMFSTLHKTNIKFSVTSILSSATAFELDKPKILLFGNELFKLILKYMCLVFGLYTVCLFHTLPLI